MVYPKTGFIVIDTLQKVRGVTKNGSTQYASDYDDLSGIKQIADKHNICILLVHHTRKQSDEKDPFNEINGTNGISGTADTMYVLKKKDRFSEEAYLFTTGRDIAQEKLTLKFEDNIWHCIDCQGNQDITKEQIPSFVFSVSNFVKEKGEFIGTITELLTEINEVDLMSNMASKWLTQYYGDVFEKENISLSSVRHARGRIFTLKHNF